MGLEARVLAISSLLLSPPERTIDLDFLTCAISNSFNKFSKIILQNLLNEFDINHVRKSKSIVLSGGERRRLEIARTLASNPKYLLLDEPLTGIDPVSIEEIKIIINKLKKKNIGVLITDHNVRETLQIVDKVYIVNEGAIFFEGSPTDAVGDEKIKKFYLGSEFKL